jgi:hypothetical protein
MRRQPTGTHPPGRNAGFTLLEVLCVRRFRACFAVVLEIFRLDAEHGPAKEYTEVALIAHRHGPGCLISRSKRASD